MTRSLIEQVLAVAGPQAISLRLSDAPTPMDLCWPGSDAKGIDTLVSLPEDRLPYQDLQRLAEGQLIDWSHHRYLRTIGGHKQVREVEVTATGELTSWDGFTEAAASYGAPDASLWACLIRDVTTAEVASKPPRAEVAYPPLRRWLCRLTGVRVHAWHIEDDTYRELKEGWGLSSNVGDVISLLPWGARP